MTLEEIKKIVEYRLPFQRLDPRSKTLHVLDCLLSNYELPQTVEEIQSFTNLDSTIIQEALEAFVNEKIIILQKDEDEAAYVANFHSPKTAGLFQYYRAVLDENLSNLEYNKIDLK
ncbi:MAG: hypothetical protein HZA84_06120 [Thaumarchaeota archaeon]|nr:hypothetical protein [Nitrososphaerota archaeon]